ncbi:MAG: hypothetical protein UH241_06755 [Acutalibacteraceae bacterium]|nr:hypothetical protein [Acutalibacteraceae bacterium]
MKSALIYYTARKTGYCESALRSCTDSMGVTIDKIMASVTCTNLGDNINSCLDEYDALFIVGDITRRDKTGVMPVLSCGLKDKNASSKQLIAEDSKGFLIEFENKKLVVLPDTPEQISKLVSVPLINYLKMGK